MSDGSSGDGIADEQRLRVSWGDQHYEVRLSNFEKSRVGQVEYIFGKALHELHCREHDAAARLFEMEQLLRDVGMKFPDAETYIRFALQKQRGF